MGLERDKIDIFINGGSHHLPRLKMLLPKMHPHGRVHLGGDPGDERGQEAAGQAGGGPVG